MQSLSLFCRDRTYTLHIRWEKGPVYSVCDLGGYVYSTHVTWPDAIKAAAEQLAIWACEPDEE